MLRFRDPMPVTPSGGADLRRRVARCRASGLPFERLTRFAIRFRWAIVVAWIAGVVLATAAVPSVSSVANSNSTQGG